MTSIRRPLIGNVGASRGMGGALRPMTGRGIGAATRLAGATPTPTATSQVGIPEYAKPYAKGMLDAASRRMNPVGFFKKGGTVKESKEMTAKEVAFMKKKGAPKSMLKHEMAEAKGMKKGGYVGGGKVSAKETMGSRTMGKVVAGGKKPHGEHTVQKSGNTKGKMVKMAGGGMRGGKC